MDANDFWAKQREKNKAGQPKYKVFTGAKTPEEQLMSEWIDRWHDQFDYFNNRGCGCCINIYEFDVPEEALNELPAELIEMCEEAQQPPRTGTPSTFSQFFSQFAKPKNDR